MFKAITAYSTKTDCEDIVSDLVGNANLKLGIYRPSAAIFYSSCIQDRDKFSNIIKGICTAYPGIELVGGTVIGGFTEDSSYIKDGYFLCLLVSDTAIFRASYITNLSSLIESDTLSGKFRADVENHSLNEGPAACFLFSAYNVDGNKVIDTVRKTLPEKCLIFGGIATDYWTEEDIENASTRTPPTENTLLFYAKDNVVNITDDSIISLLFYGNLKAKHRVSYGWSDIGMRYPGRAEGATLVELNGKQPQTFLRELKHPLASVKNSYIEYALWFHVPGKDPFLRDIFFDNQIGRYYTKGSSLPSHFHVSFSFPTKENVLKEFRNCLDQIGGKHSLAIATICCTHQIVLGQQISQEYDEMARRLTQTPTIGGYVFGEFGPSITEQKSMLHSCSGILFCLEEEDDNGVDERTLNTFLEQTIKEQRKEIYSLQEQLNFFENSKYNKTKKLSEDCLGILLCQSYRSLSNHAEQISKALKTYHKKMGIKAPYATSRNRLIDHLMKSKKRAQNILSTSEGDESSE